MASAHTCSPSRVAAIVPPGKRLQDLFRLISLSRYFPDKSILTETTLVSPTDLSPANSQATEVGDIDRARPLSDSVQTAAISKGVRSLFTSRAISTRCS